MLHSHLVVVDLVSNVNQLLLVHPDQLQVFGGDIVIISFHFSESFFVILHKIVDMLVLSFFDLMDFYLHSQLQLFLKLH